MDADEYATQFHLDITLDDLTRDRSLQIAPGISGFTCREQFRRALAGVTPDTSPNMGRARAGTYWHAGVFGARARLNTHLMHDVPLVCTYPNGVKLPGTADEIDPTEPSVTDGKGLALDTPIPTPDGWTTMGELSVGQQVFGADGKPCRVTAKSRTHYRDCFRIRFDDATEIVTDDEHLWQVDTDSGTVVRSTRELAGQVFNKAARPQRHLRVRNTHPLWLPDADLPIPPYTFGAWLGDGASKNAVITVADKDVALLDPIRDEGVPVAEYGCGRAGTTGLYSLGVRERKRDAATGRMVANDGLASQLKTLGVWGDKQIPLVYQRASYTQRLLLLRGLMDTDGSWNRPRHRAEFVSTRKLLASQVFELVASLGWKPSLATTSKTGFGVCVTAYTVSFRPLDANPFALRRKALLVDTLHQGGAKAKRRLIKLITPTLTVPTACITVDSPDHLYLAGQQMVPTHNSKDGLALVRRQLRQGEGPDWHDRVQVHSYYHAAVQQGLLPPEGIVRLVYGDRSGEEERVVVWQDPYDPQVVDEASAWLDDVLYARRHDEDASRDKDYEWCQQWCQFFHGCRGDQKPLPVITDPELVRAITAYFDAKGEEEEAVRVKEEARRLLRGVSGVTPYLEARWISVQPSEKRAGYDRLIVRQRRVS